MVIKHHLKNSLQIIKLINVATPRLVLLKMCINDFLQFSGCFSEASDAFSQFFSCHRILVHLETENFLRDINFGQV